ncbi:MAG: hypothetical protein IJ390_11680 [Lachnospiraceae bacterium]|nr:hypothetical protein [Lachnospiraceae bacterium]
MEKKKTVYANLSNLTAVDHLGRRLPEYGEVREKQDGKVVALFYYLWLGYHGTNGPYDISKILEKQPDAMEHPESPVWPSSANAPMLHWGEPMFGYYLSEDEWVLRRHVQMFIDAGIDVLFFDVTNGFTYRKAYLKLFRILSELMRDGFPVPKVAFYLAPETRGCGTGNMMELWEQLYEPHLYPELWFYWKGKPLIICHSARAIPDEIREFFTWRSPTWKDPKRPNTWAWEGNPQKVAVDEFGNPEEIAVNVCRVGADASYDPKGYSIGMSDGYWGVPVFGRSWHDGARDTRENASHYGFHFQEQAEYALKQDPPVAFLCQWNEWLVPFLTQDTIAAPSYQKAHYIHFQDEFDEEYSRDLEPMKGGYQDAYYLQMAAFGRRLKGMEKPAAETEEHTIDMNDFSSWESVSLTYREYTGDVNPRDYRAYDAIGRYTNDTGRNEFRTLKAAADAEYVYFYAECSHPLTPSTDPNWMLLFLKTEIEAPAWEGYQFVVNRKTPSEKEAVLERCCAEGLYEWEEVKKVEWFCQKNQIHYKIPKKVLGLPAEGTFRIAFKWSDNMQEADVMDFYINGDAAPRGRMNYLYIFEK